MGQAPFEASYQPSSSPRRRGSISSADRDQSARPASPGSRLRGNNGGGGSAGPRSLLDQPADTSYTASLFTRGRPKIAQKLGEEAVETVIAACSGDEASIVPEAADLMFHLAVLLADAGLSLDDVRAELERREGVGGLVEKAARTG
ncbi:MAG: phosphoribosyl-ATP diphosphatase [Sphingomonas sp.]|nr:MAG: phosphoribosyl-ATP diphosphatase [Sphingomonas sp.]